MPIQYDYPGIYDHTEYSYDGDLVPGGTSTSTSSTTSTSTSTSTSTTTTLADYIPIFGRIYQRDTS